MGRKELKPVDWLIPVVLAVVGVTAAGCATGKNAEYPVAVTAAGNLPAVNSLAASDTLSAGSLADPFGHGELEAVVSPPAGWNPDPIKRTRTHAHQAWISPSGRTAFGVIRMNLPLPFIGPGVVLPRFLDQMRETEGEARLLSRQNDSDLHGIRFVAEGGQYRLRANLMTRGFRAWAIYAGTLRAQPEMPDELQLAEAAREETRIGTTRVRSKNR